MLAFAESPGSIVAAKVIHRHHTMQLLGKHTCFALLLARG